MKRILVTGGAGFIGSHLVERLVRDGHHVTVFDNSPAQLGQDEFVARREGLSVRTVQGVNGVENLLHTPGAEAPTAS